MSEFTLENYQKWVAAKLHAESPYDDRCEDLESIVKNLSGEVCELFGALQVDREIKKSYWMLKPEYIPKESLSLGKEMGDCLFYLVALMIKSDIDLEFIIKSNIEKLDHRVSKSSTIPEDKKTFWKDIK